MERIAILIGPNGETKKKIEKATKTSISVDSTDGLVRIFSTPEMRKEGGIELIIDTMEKLSRTHKEHIKVYGLHNEQRMTGEHETSSIKEFSYGYSTRDTSIRIPAQATIDGKGYFEDRRPASNCDPYSVALRMLQTVYNNELEVIESYG